MGFIRDFLPGDGPSKPTGSRGGGVEALEKIYPTTKQGTSAIFNWYEQKPYTFIFTDRGGEKATFNLPISPSNLNITTHFATNVISTMYGTVEEHSEVRYYDITIAGTTGMSPKYYKPMEEQTIAGTGRAAYKIKADLFGGFASRTQALVSNTLNQAADLFGLGEDGPEKGVDHQKTGYVAFHNLYKFFLLYKKDASGESSVKKRTKHPLRFVNYKDNNEYDVAINTFQLTRDVNNPMLYNYNITMRAYNLRAADATGIQPDVSDRAAALGLDNVNNESLFSIMANKARQAKNTAYSAIAAVKGFGS